ncbi:MAG: hypothetical protein ACHP7N_03190 [Caulobacterales bacterium]
MGRVGVAALALCLFAGCRPTAAQESASSCAAPPPWREANAKPGQPDAEFAACLRDQAYETRTLTVPVDSTAYGIIAQCHVRVDFFEGRTMAASETGPDAAAADQEAVRQATAAITQYRRCVGR